MDEEHKQEFLHAVDAGVNELEELLPLLMKDKLLAKGVSHLLSSQLTRILRTHAAMSVLGMVCCAARVWEALWAQH